MSDTKKKTKKKQDQLFADLKVTENGRSRPLNQKERDELIAMLTVKERSEALSIDPLVPKGSYIARMLRFFHQTDASYALPLWQMIMIASSYLSQGGAHLSIPGMKDHSPILWTIALAPSASSKTLATETVADILTEKDGISGVRMLPCGGTDAQWIIDLADNNGSYWFQDEMGQFVKKVLKDKSYHRIKDWMLNAYSRKPISNRLKSDVTKLTIEDPHFTFFGLTVQETWKHDVDAASMLDGFCQRFNFVVASKRSDTDMFEHFLYFQGEGIEAKKGKLQKTWTALCHQPNALGQYRVEDDVIPYLENWFLSLRDEWGSGALPGSFIRRTGFSVLSYLTVIHFLLGRSNTPIDVETAEIATRYAEFHMESALIMIREYGDRNASHMQRVSEMRADFHANGKKDVTARDIQRRFSKAQRDEISTEMTKEILAVFNRLEVAGNLFEGAANTPTEKSALLQVRNRKFKEKEQKNEQWRNQKRLQAIQDHYEKRGNSSKCRPDVSSEASYDDDFSCVIEFGTKRSKSA